MSKYNPKTVLRQTSNSLIRELFRTCSSVPDVPWQDLGEREIRPIFEAMQTLPERERRRLVASRAGILSGEETTHPVQGVEYRVHIKRGADEDAPKTMRVDYHSSLTERHSEWRLPGTYRFAGPAGSSKPGGGSDRTPRRPMFFGGRGGRTGPRGHQGVPELGGGAEKEILTVNGRPGAIGEGVARNPR